MCFRFGGLSFVDVDHTPHDGSTEKIVMLVYIFRVEDVSLY